MTGEPVGPTNAAERIGLRRALLWSAGLTGLLWVVPFGDVIGYPLLLVSTLVHELGHGLTAELVGGDFVRFAMAADGSGVATSAVDGRFDRALVAAGGLVGPAVAAFLGFVAGRRPRSARLFLLAVAVLLTIATVVWVRSLVAAAVATSLVVVCTAAAFAPPRLRGAPQAVLLFLSIQLALSVFSRGEYLFASTASVDGQVLTSDTAAIAAALAGPPALWGIVCGAFSLIVLAAGLWLLWLSLAPRSSGSTPAG